MPISHPNMKSKQSPTQQPQKEVYIVEDASAVPQSHGQLGVSNQQMYVPEPSVPQSHGQLGMSDQQYVPNRLLEDLLFLGRVTSTIEMGGHKFEISTLTHKEHNDLMKKLYTFTNGADLFTVRTLTMAHALRTVDGTPLEELSDDEYPTIYDKKVAIIDSLQLSVVEQLFDSYNKLKAQTEKASSGSEIKK